MCTHMATVEAPHPHKRTHSHARGAQSIGRSLNSITRPVKLGAAHFLSRRNAICQGGGESSAGARSLRPTRSTSGAEMRIDTQICNPHSGAALFSLIRSPKNGPRRNFHLKSFNNISYNIKGEKYHRTHLSANLIKQHTGLRITRQQRENRTSLIYQTLRLLFCSTACFAPAKKRLCGIKSLRRSEKPSGKITNGG